MQKEKFSFTRIDLLLNGNFYKTAIYYLFLNGNLLNNFLVSPLENNALRH